MKAVSLKGPAQCQLIESPMPEPDGDRVIIKVSACGICGSDIHFWKHGVGMDKQPGLIMGHEFCGHVHDPGSRTDLATGDRVTVIPINPCSTCIYCSQGKPNLCRESSRRPLPGLSAPGAYAEYCMVRSDMVRKIPDSVSDNEAAQIEPAAVALHAVYQADIECGQRVLISGGGPVGLLCAMWARQRGASHVALTEINPFRIQFARNTPYISAAMDAHDSGLGRMLKKNNEGFERVIETSASEAGINLGLTALKPQGKLVLTGISYAPQQISTLVCTLKEAEIKSAFGYTLSEFDMALDFIAHQKILPDHLVTRSISLGQVQATFEQLSSNTLNDMKIIINPWDVY